MRARRWVVMGSMLLASAAAAQDKTFQPSKLTLTVPQGWEVMSERYSDFLHYESSEDSDPREIDVSFVREQTTCKAWRAAGGKKEQPAYWPKKAKTKLFTVKADGKIRQTGCLADTPTGALIAELETTTENPRYKPSATDQAMLRDALAAALAGAIAPPAVKPPEPTAVTSGSPGTQATPARMPALDKPEFAKGGTKVTIPRLDLTLKLPKGESWIVGARGEPKLERAAGTYDPAVVPVSVGVFALPSRTCQEWRVDTSTSSVMSFIEKPAYVPAPFKIGAFAYTVGTGTQVSTCLDTKVGALGIAFEYDGALDGADVTLVKSLLDAIAVGASKHARPTFPGSIVVDGGTKANASAATITLPKAATWRVTNGTIERFDNGRYFSLASMSRPATCNAKTATDQPFLPAGVKGVVETKPWGTTVAKVCIQTTRAIELTLAYDGAIAEVDRSLIKALVESFSAKKPAPKS